MITFFCFANKKYINFNKSINFSTLFNILKYLLVIKKRLIIFSIKKLNFINLNQYLNYKYYFQFVFSLFIEKLNIFNSNTNKIWWIIYLLKKNINFNFLTINEQFAKFQPDLYEDLKINSFFRKDYINLINNSHDTIIEDFDWLDEEKKFLISINSLFLEGSKYWHNFIFDELYFLDKILYLNTYLYEKKLLKYLINIISYPRWQNFFNNQLINGVELFEFYSINKSNFLPLNMLRETLAEKIIIKYISLQTKGLKWMIQNFFYSIIYNIFKNNLYININKYKNFYTIKNEDIINFLKKFNSPFLNKNLNLELINIIITLIFYKDPKILVEWIEYNLINLYFAKHLKFINFIQLLFKDLFLYYAETNKLIGYKFIFKGKINKLGNVRKRKFIYSKSLISFSNINYRSDLYSKPIATITGIINCKLIINYY